MEPVKKVDIKNVGDSLILSRHDSDSNLTVDIKIHKDKDNYFHIIVVEDGEMIYSHYNLNKEFIITMFFDKQFEHYGKVISTSNAEELRQLLNNMTPRSE